jgi:hypothetical protein
VNNFYGILIIKLIENGFGNKVIRGKYFVDGARSNEWIETMACIFFGRICIFISW